MATATQVCNAAAKMGCKGKFFSRFLAHRGLKSAERDWHHNVRRLIQRPFGADSDLLRTYMVSFPLLHPTRNEIVDEMLPILLPWQVAQALRAASKLVGPLLHADGTAFNARYWNAVKGCSWALKHDIWSVPLPQREFCCPLMLFCDEIKFFKGSGKDVCFYVYNWTTMGGHGATRGCKHWLFMVPGWRAVPATHAKAASVCAWLLRELQKGIDSPDLRGYHGEVLPRLQQRAGPAHDLRFFFVAFKSDASQKKVNHAYPECAQANAICELCPAHKTTAAYNFADVDVTANWARELRTHEDYLAACGAHPSPWCELPNWRAPHEHALYGI